MGKSIFIYLLTRYFFKVKYSVFDGFDMCTVSKLDPYIPGRGILKN